MSDALISVRTVFNANFCDSLIMAILNCHDLFQGIIMIIQRLLPMFTWLVVGYLIGMTIGFTFFDPNLDLWALLGTGFAIFGLVVGLMPFAKRHVNAALLGIFGFYVGAIACIVLFGNSSWDFFNTLTIGGVGAMLPIGGAILGAVAGMRIAKTMMLPLFGLVFGGFIGGLLLYSFAMWLGVKVPRTMLGYAPFTIGAGVTLCVLAWRFAATRTRNIAAVGAENSIDK
jgi:MFS family permease